MTADLRSEWVCSECDVRCYRMTREPFPRPEGWVGDLCLACAKATESPIESARRQVLEGRSNGRIKVKGVSSKTLNEMRAEVVEAGELDPAVAERATTPKPKGDPKPKPEPKAPDPKRTESEKVMTENPVMSNGEIANLTGASRKAVGIWRRKLGIPTSENVRRDEATALISGDPTLRNAEVQERMRYPVSASLIRVIRSELSIAPPTVGSNR